MMGLSTTHLIILLVIVVIIFGTKKLKNLGQDLGGAVKGFKDGMKDGEKSEDLNKTKEQVAQQPAETSVPAAEVTPPQVTAPAREHKDYTTIDVETKIK